MKRLALSMASLIAVAVSSAAQARDAVMTVKVSDLNLNTAAGATAAVQRIALAARDFCGEADARDLGRSAVVAHCRAYMARRAVAITEAPVLTAAYEGRAATVTLAAR